MLRALTRRVRFSRHIHSSRPLMKEGPEVAYRFALGRPPAAKTLTTNFEVTGGKLKDMTIAYETWGILNKAKDNAILLHCGMSASSHAKSSDQDPAPGWWEKFIGPGLALDTDLFYVICVNNLGSCYGSTGPSSVNPATNKPYGSSFPPFTVQDQVRCQFALLDDLGIDKLHASVGSSLGGMQSLAAASMYPDRVRNVVSISACPATHPAGIAYRQMQRECISSDPNWKNGDYYYDEPPLSGLKLARQIGTLTYRSGPEWETRFGRRRISDDITIGKNFEIESYIAHQGEKWANAGAFDPNSLIWMSTAMDWFTLEKTDPVTGENSLKEGFKDIQQPALVIGVQTDVLFPIWQQKKVAELLRSVGNSHVSYYELDSYYGHDTFLLDTVSIGGAVKGHLEQEPNGANHLFRETALGASLVLRSLQERDSCNIDLEDVFYALDSDSDGHIQVQKISAYLYLYYTLTQVSKGLTCQNLTLEKTTDIVLECSKGEPIINKEDLMTKHKEMSAKILAMCTSGQCELSAH